MSAKLATILQNLAQETNQMEMKHHMVMLQTCSSQINHVDPNKLDELLQRTLADSHKNNKLYEDLIVIIKKREAELSLMYDHADKLQATNAYCKNIGHFCREAVNEMQHCYKCNHNVKISWKTQSLHECQSAAFTTEQEAVDFIIDKLWFNNLLNTNLLRDRYNIIDSDFAPLLSDSKIIAILKRDYNSIVSIDELCKSYGAQGYGYKWHVDVNTFYTK